LLACIDKWYSARRKILGLELFRIHPSKRKKVGDDVGRGNFLAMIEMPRDKEAGASAQVSSQAGAWEQGEGEVGAYRQVCSQAGA